MTREEKELLEYIKNGNNILGVTTELFYTNTPLDEKIKSSLIKINKTGDIIINIIESKEIYAKTKDRKKVLAKFASNVFAGLVTAIIIGASISSGQAEFVVITLIANDFIQQQSEDFLNKLFDYIELEYDGMIRKIQGFENSIINEFINHRINGI